MKRTILTSVSALALMAMVPVSIASMAHAAENVKGSMAAETQTDLKRMQPDPNQVLTQQEAERALDKAERKVNNAVNGNDDRNVNANANANVKANAHVDTTANNNNRTSAEELGDNVEYTLFGKEKDGVASSIQANATAQGMLNQPVNNMANERVGTLRDIIIDSKGAAQLAVVSDTRIPGIGKEAAFEYSMVMRQNANGDVVMPISEDRIKSARSFSYDQDEVGEDADVRTIPAGGYSIDKLLSANVVNAQGDKVASVENVTFRNGKVDAVIIGYDKTLGMGGKKAALRFSEVKMNAKGDGDAELQLTTQQASQLETLKDRRASN